MHIAMYAPLKPPDHPVPSGDRQMARLLMAAMRGAGHEVSLVSRLRSYASSAVPETLGELQAKADRETERIGENWRTQGAPDLWLTYHPYYKAPDLIGPPLCARLAVPYVTAEASYSARRDRDEWAPYQAHVTAAVRLAALNICFTQRDRDGLAHLVAARRLAHLPPFIDGSPFADERSPRSADGPDGSVARLVAVAMLRKGDKSASFRMLAAALELIDDLDWQLTIIGGGPARDEVRAMFRGLGRERIAWLGEAAPENVAGHLHGGDLYVWPGCGEAYGLAYLEAQAAGLPVIAQETAGVPEVVRSGTTGLLTREGDVSQFAQAIRRLILDPERRQRMAAAARQFALGERSLERASEQLGVLLARAAPGKAGLPRMDDRADAAALWRPLSEELERWKSAGRTARLWLRDDDACEPTPALARLSELTARFQVPLVLAVIPARTGDDLARRLESEVHIHPAVHGWSHQNHAPPPEKRQELGPHRPRPTVLDELARALERMRALYGERLIAMLVPPWNRIDAALIGELPQLGFRALSTFGPEPAVTPIPVVNTHVDLIDSRAGHRCREPHVLVGRLVEELARARSGNGHPVGVLSHHLAGDEKALHFLERLFDMTGGHPACRWQGPSELLATHAADDAS